MVKLFDDIEHKGDGPPEYQESQFAYLNRIARKDAFRIREVLEDWFSHYPDVNDKADLRGRFRDKDHIQHESAFFELLLHEMLIRLGYKVDIHPQVDEAIERRPDFLAILEGRKEFIVEAVLALDRSRKDTATRARKNVVYDTINKLKSPKFFIGMKLFGDPQTPPPGKKIRKLLKEEIDNLDYDDVVARYKEGDIDCLPKWPFEHDGWSIEFFPIPKSEDAIGKPGIRPIGLVSFGYFEVDPIMTIREAILSKAKAYGKPKLPFIVAVNNFERHVDYPEIMEVLFGRWKYSFAKLDDGSVSTKEERDLDGVWTSRAGPRNRQLTAVLIFQDVTSWNFAGRNVRLYHNPYISDLYDTELMQLPQMIPKDMMLHDGKSVGSIFGLETSWPGEK
jgi:hypothetical protein